MTAKVQVGLNLQGGFQFSYSGRRFNGKFQARMEETWWGIPEVGVVKSITNGSVSASVAGYGGETVKVSQTQLLTDYFTG